MSVDQLTDISERERERLLAVRDNILDASALNSQLKELYPAIEDFTELPILGIDYTAVVPILKFWLKKVERLDNKVEIAKLLAFPRFECAADIARELRRVASLVSVEESADEARQTALEFLSQLVVQATPKGDRGGLFELAADRALPITSRYFFLEAMAKENDKRVSPLLQELLTFPNPPGRISRLLKLLAKVDVIGSREIAFVLRDHADGQVRSIAAKILNR